RYFHDPLGTDHERRRCCRAHRAGNSSAYPPGPALAHATQLKRGISAPRYRGAETDRSWNGPPRCGVPLPYFPMPVMREAANLRSLPVAGVPFVSAHALVGPLVRGNIPYMIEW